jgi:hypothetical protein
MKIKVSGAGMSVTLDVSYRSWTSDDDPWTASPIGSIGADNGHWKIESNAYGPNNILFYGKDIKDRILLFEAVTPKLHGNPFKKGDSGSGSHESPGGTMPTGATLDWVVS